MTIKSCGEAVAPFNYIALIALKYYKLHEFHACI